MARTDLATLDKASLNELVATLPANKRAAFSKAAKAACQHLRDSKANYSKAYEIASVMVENWWRLGLELPRLDIKPGQPKKNGPPGDNTLLRELGINRNQSARCQKLAEKSKAELDEWLEVNYDEEKYYLPSLRPASETHVSNNSGFPEWYTPREYIEAAREVLGNIDLDPASSAVAQKIVKADKYYGVRQDGLSKTWTGSIWLNPPYSAGLIDQFMSKLTEHIEQKEVSQAITLTNNSTDTKWFQSASKLASAICLVSGRIKYLGESLIPENSPLQGQLLLYFGSKKQSFCSIFREFGVCWKIK